MNPAPIVQGGKPSGIDRPKRKERSSRTALNGAPDSITKTTESGAFIRTTIRKGKRRKQKTTRIKPNMEKVVLCHLGDFEVYVYPYDFPDRVFIGKFPVSTQLESDHPMLRAYNMIKAYLNGEYFQNKVKQRKATESRRRHIVSAYNSGLKRHSEGQNGQEKNKL